MRTKRKEKKRKPWVKRSYIDGEILHSVTQRRQRQLECRFGLRRNSGGGVSDEEDKMFRVWKGRR